MKIRRKISLIFTALSTIVLFFAFAFIYYLSARNTQTDFYTRLQEKATLTAWKYFEKDELSNPAYNDVIDKYEKNLPDATEIILRADNSGYERDSLKKIIPVDLIPLLQRNGEIHFRAKNRQWVGLYYRDNQGNFIIIISATDKFGIKRQQHLLRILGLIFLGSIFFIYMMGQFYARRVLSPVTNIMRNVRNINATNLSLRLKERKGDDELTELTRMFNQMLERLEGSFTMQKNFISHASHELKNPLTAILGETEVTLARNRKPEEYIDALNKIMSEAERLEMLTKNLLALAQTDYDLLASNPDIIRIDQLLKVLADHFNKTDYQGRIVFHGLSNDASFSTKGSENLLRIAFSNLIDNACKFSGNQPVDVTVKGGKSDISISIADRGIGIPSDELQNLFQPFSRAGNAITFKGSGVGLSLVKKIIDIHNGEIRISSEVGKGTIMEVRLPLV